MDLYAHDAVFVFKFIYLAAHGSDMSDAKLAIPKPVQIFRHAPMRSRWKYAAFALSNRSFSNIPLWAIV